MNDSNPVNTKTPLDKTRAVATLFEVERFAIHDGPGIRTVVFLKGCNLDCRWCANPESKNHLFEIGYAANECVHCGRCIAACPHGLIQSGETGIRFTSFDPCADCSRCIDMCHRNALIRFGKKITPTELMELVLRDKDFYLQSGGGVTFSGGEPLLQIDFLIEALNACQKNGIHTAIETAGNVKYERFDRINEYVNLYLFDIKHLDSDQHKLYTGSGNTLILENLKKLDAAGKEFIARIPLMPGYNDSPAYLEILFSHLSKYQNLRSVHILPYHELGKSKYLWLNLPFEKVFPKYSKTEFEKKTEEIHRANLPFGMSLTIGGLE